MRTVSITGATGFIGTHLVRHLLRRDDLTVRALVHETPEAILPRSPRLQWMRGDLSDRATLQSLVGPGWDLVNLAYPAEWAHERHLEAAGALARAALDAGVRRIVHCSTAAVAGSARAQCVTEATVPEPAPGYERTKLEIEKAWLASCRGRLELAILRPTAVYGPHGRNLLKLARDLTSGSAFVNYLRSSLYRRRRMNLVNVGNVAAAVEFLLEQPLPGAGEIYIASDDEEPGNNFRDVEKMLMGAWGRRDYPLPPLPVPPFVLASLLRLAGRSNADPSRTYDGSKLLQAGLQKPCRLEQGIAEFASWYAGSRADAARTTT